MLDLENENALPAVSGAFEVALDAPGAPRYYKVIMGTDAFVAKESNGIPLTPVSYALEQNYPNPFNPSTTISYGLPQKANVSLVVYNTLGQAIATLVNREEEAGYHQARFDGSNVASGVYFCRLTAGDFVRTSKLVLLR